MIGTSLRFAYLLSSSRLQAMGFSNLTSQLSRLTFGGTDSGSDDSDSEFSDSGSSSNTESDEESKDPRDKIVAKSEDEEREFRVLTLNNGLKCLLISNGDEDYSNSSSQNINGESGEKAAACLTVKVGSACDPHQVPGLAHFLEHMLFMGSKKYPDENEYGSFLSRHGGSSNATTDYELTKYFFDVSAPHLEGALDRFCSQFISPLLKKSAVKREANAVDSEWGESLQKDSERRSQLYYSLFESDHPWNKFSCGNKKTLLEDTKNVYHIDILAALRKFHETYYSASNMFLCVQSDENLDRLEKMVKRFEKIPSKKIKLPFLSSAIPHLKYNFIKYYPVKEKNKLLVTWYVTSQNKYYKSKPDEYLGKIIGYQGKGSLTTKLKREGLVSKLVAGITDSNAVFTTYEVSFTLTDIGVDQYQEVIGHLFQFLAMLRKVGPSKRIFDEMAKLGEIDFENEGIDEPIDTVEELCESMTLYEPEHYLNGPYLFYNFNPELITRLLEELVPETMVVTLQCKRFQQECTQVEPWVGGKYRAERLPEWFIDKMRVKLDNPSVITPYKLPPKNPFIAKNFDAKDCDVDAPPAIPLLIKQDANQKIWYLKDESFDDPEAYIYIRIFTDKLMEDIQKFSLFNFFFEYVSYKTEEKYYQASEAGLNHSVASGTDGWSFQFDGYSDKMLKLFKSVVKKYGNPTSIDKNYFNAIKEKLIKDYRTSLQKPEDFAETLRAQFLLKNIFLPTDVAKCIEQIQMHDLKELDPKNLSGFYVESLYGGNVVGEEILESYSKIFVNSLNIGKEKSLEKLPQDRVYQIPYGKYRYVCKNKNQSDVNSVVINYYQNDRVVFKEVLILELLESLMSDHMFNQLRTILQLGYNLDLASCQTAGVTGFQFTINTQANKFTGNEINIYIEKFLLWFKTYLETMDEETFEEHLSNLVGDKQANSKGADEAMELMWQEILAQEYIFDRDRRAAEVLKEVSKAEVLQLYDKMFCSKVRKISIQVEGNPFGVDQSEPSDRDRDDDMSHSKSENMVQTIPDMTKLKPAEIISWPKMTDIKSIEDFRKEKCRLMPVYRMKCEVVTRDCTDS